MSAAARPLYLFGHKALEQFAAEARAALAPLLSRWWSGRRCIQVIGTTPWDPALHASPVRHVVRGQASGWLAFLGTEQIWNKIAATWLDCEVGGGGPLVHALERAFCMAVYDCFKPGAAAVGMDADAWEHIPASALQVGAGTVIVELDIDGVPLALVAPLSLWRDPQDWPDQKPSTTKLERRSDALSQSFMRLDVTLPPVQMPAAELAELAVGDFLNLEHGLGGAVRLRCADANWELSGTLGQSGGHRAVRIHQQSGARS